MKDAMRTLRDARPAELDPGAPLDERVRHAELARAMATAPWGEAPVREVVPVRRRRVRPVWGLGLAAAVAAGAVAAVTLVPTGGDGPARHAPGAGAEQVIDVRTVLLTAADKAAAQPDQMRTYWHDRTIASFYFRVGKGDAAYTIVMRQMEEGWVPSSPTGRRWGAVHQLDAKPATMRDVQAWKRAGSPTTFKSEVSITRGNNKIRKPIEINAAPGERTLSSSPLKDGMIFWIGRNVTMKDLRSLPSDPAKLKAHLLRDYKGHGTEGDVPMGADAWLFEVARGVVGMPVKPAVRSAAFRVLAGLPQVKSIGKVVDSEGRKGDAVAMDERTDAGVIRHRVVLDLSTGTALAFDSILLKPSAGAEFKAGQVLDSMVTVTAEWTDAQPK
ncbi:CU044_5270 family protein [Actinomadura chibensis]|uniref:CU044_5270 family protein n=1 Tax=Actinomadura chibensis TaxID=392828 RepID=A0A5D0NZI1_9ACTN|nr:CU044_5270 family protein [Actinomadura chibensis]TYB49568.1 hypothetical protein FXF69_10970 [Actinomadura chibensis]